jgi:hypothetical protein
LDHFGILQFGTHISLGIKSVGAGRGAVKPAVFVNIDSQRLWGDAGDRFKKISPFVLFFHVGMKMPISAV